MKINSGHTKTLLLNERGRGFALFCASSFFLTMNYLLYATSSFDVFQTLFRVVAVLFLVGVYASNSAQIALNFAEIFAAIFSFALILLNGAEPLNALLVMLWGICSRAFALKKILKALLIMALVSVAAYCLLYAGGMLHDVQYASSLGRVRHTLGFDNPNQASIFFMSLFIAPVAVRKHKTLAIIAVLLVSFLIYTLSDTRTVLFTAVLFCAFILLFSRLCTSTKAITAVVMTVALISIVGSFLIPCFRDTVLDEVLSYRATYYAEGLNGLSLIQFFIGCSDQPKLPVDNFFVYAFIMYGIFMGCFLYYEILKAAKAISRSGDSYLTALFCSLLLMGMVESFLIRPELTITLSFWAIVFSFNKVHPMIMKNKEGEKSACS